MCPIYEYYCGECDKGFEVFYGSASLGKDEALCPKCNRKVKKVPAHGSTFLLKGGGWYKDGYNK